MSDRRTFLRGLVSLPLIGGGVTLIGRPAQAVPLVQVAALPTLDDPRQRARYAWEAFSAAMRDLTPDAEGWCILGAAERYRQVLHMGPMSFLRVAAIRYEIEQKQHWQKPLMIERNPEIEL